MRITLKQLKHLSVETYSGQQLGHVSDLIFEIDGQLIAQYVVKFSFLSTKQYTINRDQVVSIGSEKMIVDNSVYADNEDIKKEATSPVPEPVVMAEEAGK